MKKYSVDFYDYNLDVFIKGLEKVGIKFEDLTDEQIGKMLSYTIGYCDFSNESIIKDLLKEIQK